MEGRWLQGLMTIQCVYGILPQEKLSKFWKDIKARTLVGLGFSNTSVLHHSLYELDSSFLVLGSHPRERKQLLFGLRPKSTPGHRFTKKSREIFCPEVSNSFQKVGTVPVGSRDPRMRPPSPVPVLLKRKISAT